MNDLRIKELLQERGMTQKQLADRLGIGEVSLSRAIGRGKLSADYLRRIADALKVSVPDLFAHTITCPHCGHKFTVSIKTE